MVKKILVITAVTTAAVFYTNIISLPFILILKTPTLLLVPNKVESRFSTFLKTTLSNGITIYGDFKTVLKFTLVINTYPAL